MNHPTITILSTADFDNPVWTNKQHLAVGLSEELNVNYINSLGLRNPSFNRTDISRIIKRLSGTLKRTVQEEPTVAERRINIISPHIIPFHQFGIVRKLNRVFLKGYLRGIPRHERDVLWTFSPLTYGLEDEFRRCVYHSVDLLHTVPGIPRDVLLEEEARLLSKVDQIIASSEGVADHLRALKFPDNDIVVRVWENVADTQLYEMNAAPERSPRAFFSGNLTPTKIDFALLTDLAETGISIALAGPIGFDGTSADGDLKRLLKFPNVEYLGLLEPEELAKEVGKSSVGLIPYKVNSHTKGIFPMKVYEYLAAGLSVVTTPLPSLADRPGIVGVNLVTPSLFVETVVSAVSSFNCKDAELRTEAARPFSWANRFAEAKALISEMTA